MGSATTENTEVGRRGSHYRPILRRLIRQVELHPPAGVSITPGHGGKNHLSPHGYVGKHLWEWAEERRKQAVANGDLSAFNWEDSGGAVTFLSRTVMKGTSFGHHRGWDLIEAWLPVFREHMREVMAKPVGEDDEDSRQVFERQEAEEERRATRRFTTDATAVAFLGNPPSPVRAADGATARPSALVPFPHTPLVDPEIVAVAEIVAALNNLPDNDARKRSLVYAADRFGLEFAGVPIQGRDNA